MTARVAWAVRVYAPSIAALIAWHRFGVWLRAAFPGSAGVVQVSRDRPRDKYAWVLVAAPRKEG